ncbi:hypothetical protein [Paraburkholderia sp. Ac-20347]|uniref:hypothetical protein n=1 Tax=Paraburkholderia sp. Ac-20347 TaxID=2703892 RepID=UPI00198211BA|nr:hypothetical protein [Paraburkholderia sp. Ac-20347]MBN3809417.1 hypothetical protein [Paraburkholderia sp. Ac-20347]
MPPRTPSELKDQAAAELIGDETPQETPEQLRERIKSLEAALEKSTAAKNLAEEESARLSAQAQNALLTSSVIERFAGKTEDGKDLWWYRIDLAPCGGVQVLMNGKPYMHGETYKFDTDTLRTVKEIVARTWIHENDINGNKFDPYRKAQNKVLGGGAAPNWAYQ